MKWYNSRLLIINACKIIMVKLVIIIIAIVITIIAVVLQLVFNYPTLHGLY